MATFVHKVGADALMKRVGVGHQMVARAVRLGVMPPHWFEGAEELAKDKNMDHMPRELFDFNKPADAAQKE